MSTAVHPIERESYRILRSLVDLSHLPPLSRNVTERVIHASADLEYAQTLVADEAALGQGRDALAAGAPLVVDAQMVAAGIPSRPTRCLVADPRARELAEAEGITRSAAGFRLAAADAGPGAVWVVGNAPTALLELVALSPDDAERAFSRRYAGLEAGRGRPG
jgi:precorrin-8X/cobalt-precorrin-8 methylmutase